VVVAEMSTVKGGEWGGYNRRRRLPAADAQSSRLASTPPLPTVEGVVVVVVVVCAETRARAVGSVGRGGEAESIEDKMGRRKEEKAGAGKAEGVRGVAVIEVVLPTAATESVLL